MAIGTLTGDFGGTEHQHVNFDDGHKDGYRKEDLEIADPLAYLKGEELEKYQNTLNEIEKKRKDALEKLIPLFEEVEKENHEVSRKINELSDICIDTLQLMGFEDKEIYNLFNSNKISTKYLNGKINPDN